MDESMENPVIVLDTSVLIDYFRKTNKEKTFFVELSNTEVLFAASVITQFEVYVGSRKEHYPFWDKLFDSFMMLPLDHDCIRTALAIDEELKKKNKQLDFADLLIAATAKAHGLPIATLNAKHFDRVEGLTLMTRK